jgi:hypothetical protein
MSDVGLGMVFESTGTIRFFPDGSVKIMTDQGIVDYYKNRIERAHWGLKTQSGKYRSHITIVSPKLHKGVNVSPIKKKWDGKTVKFTYDPYPHMGGNPSKGFINFWLKVECPEIDEIKKTLNIVESKNFIGSHLTICNTKHL